MSELSPQPHSKEHGEIISGKELETIHEKLNNELASNAERAQSATRSAEQLTRKVEQHAISGKEMSRNETTDKQPHTVLINKQLKDMAYSRAMTRARKQLSIPSRFLSKIVHSKALDKPSEVLGNTVARPSGMLGGAFFAAIGSSVLLWLTKHYGYEYNYLAVVLLFGMGLLFGLTVELIWKNLKRR